MDKITVEISGNAREKIAAALEKVQDGRTLFQRIAQTLEAETEANFAAQGRPHWVPLSKATVAARTKRTKGASSTLKILQDRGILASSVSSEYGVDYALIGAGGAASAYAAIHQFGGTVEHAAHSRKIRHREDAKGNLMRQGKEGRAKNLAVFAKDSHKRVRESWASVDAYKVTIPARPYLPFTGTSASGTIQPEASRSILEVVDRWLAEAFQ